MLSPQRAGVMSIRASPATRIILPFPWSRGRALGRPRLSPDNLDMPLLTRLVHAGGGDRARPRLAAEKGAPGYPRWLVLPDHGVQVAHEREVIRSDDPAISQLGQRPADGLGRRRTLEGDAPHPRAGVSEVQAAADQAAHPHIAA